MWKEYTFEMLEGEFWYGPVVDDGVKYPLDKDSVYEAKLNAYGGYNQVNTLLISTKGRAIWSESGFDLSVSRGEVRIRSSKAEVNLYELGKNLKEAYLGVAKQFFELGMGVPPKEFFVKPQYNTWIEFLYGQNQQGIMEYVDKIIENQMPVGIIMIDDGWSEYYGGWRFNATKFPDPKEMVDRLHELGFKVMIWTCPFISPDSFEFRLLRDKGYLVRNQDGSVAVREWWNGYSAVLDVTHPGAVAWYYEQNQKLMDAYGIDGFKLDAGDARYYYDEDLTYEKIDANGHSQRWAKIGEAYAYNEYRACFKNAGAPLVQRLADKKHSWEDNGVAALIPNQLTQGILGYAYTCPDMIGGGECNSFVANSKQLDQELFVRYAQCAAMMPMMQFSAAPWRVLDKVYFDYCKEAAWIHVKYAEYIYTLAEVASQTGEPIVRWMAYEFPAEGLEKVTDQFMLGDKYLIAPVIQKGSTSRVIYFPAGTWQGEDQSIVEGPKALEVSVPLHRLPIYEKIK